MLLYFSASWCPPCHAFTPVLADFFEEVKDAGGSIEIVYVPGDKTKPEMLKYFRDLHGDWLALDKGPNWQTSGWSHLLAMERVVKMATALGDSATASAHTATLTKLMQAYHSTYYDSKEGSYASQSP